jgi:hypothetical protein
MYKEEMDRLGFSVGGFFKGLAALSEIKDVFEAPPKTAYEELQDKANEKYRDKPADKEMFDVTTNYLMEEEDRNIQDAELMEELNTTAESWTNAEPEKFVKHYPIEEIKLNWDEIKSEYQRDMEFFGRFADYYDVEQKRLRQEVLGLEEKKRVVEERVGIGWSSDPEWKELNKQWRGKSDEQHEMWSKYSDYKYDRPRERRKVPFTDRDLNIYIQRIKNPEEKKFALALMEWNKEQVEARNIEREKDSIYGINIYADPRLNIFSGLSGKQLTDKSYDEMRVLSRINKVNQSKGMPDEPTRIRGFKPGWHVGAQELSTIEAHTSAIMEAFDDRSWAKKRMERWKDEPLMQDAYLRAKEDFEGFGDPPLLYQSFAPDKMVSLLDQPGLYGQYKRGSDRINWDDEQTKTHELLHRYLDLSGVDDKLFKGKGADEEMFVRAYTAKILGEPLDDDFFKELKLVADKENYHNITEEYDEKGHWKRTIKSRSDIDKLRKDFPTLAKNFEELVLGRKHIELVSDEQKGKDVLSYDKSKPTILSEQILSTIQKNRGWSSEELNALKEFSNSVSKAESDNKIDVHQYGGGPGRGKYQYEIGDEQGASTARNRLLNFAKDNNITIPQKYLDLLGKQGTQSIDFSALPEDLQTALFFADKAKHPEFKLDDLVSGRLSPVDAWLAYHWAGKQELREEKKQYFLDKNKLKKIKFKSTSNLSVEKRVFIDKVWKQNKDPITAETFTDDEYYEMLDSLAVRIETGIMDGDFFFNEEGKLKSYFSFYGPAYEGLGTREEKIGGYNPTLTGYGGEFPHIEVFGNAGFDLYLDQEDASVKDDYDYGYEKGNYEVGAATPGGFLNKENRQEYIYLIKEVQKVAKDKGWTEAFNSIQARHLAERFGINQLPDEATAEFLKKEWNPVKVEVDFPISSMFTKKRWEELVTIGKENATKNPWEEESEWKKEATKFDESPIQAERIEAGWKARQEGEGSWIPPRQRIKKTLKDIFGPQSERTGRKEMGLLYTPIWKKEGLTANDIIDQESLDIAIDKDMTGMDVRSELLKISKDERNTWQNEMLDTLNEAHQKEILDPKIEKVLGKNWVLH